MKIIIIMIIMQDSGCASLLKGPRLGPRLAVNVWLMKGLSKSWVQISVGSQ